MTPHGKPKPKALFTSSLYHSRFTELTWLILILYSMEGSPFVSTLYLLLCSFFCTKCLLLPPFSASDLRSVAGQTVHIVILICTHAEH